MAILKRTIIFEDDLVNSTATLNLSSGEVKSIIFKNKTIEFFLNFNVDKAAFDEKKGFKDNPEISKKISNKLLQIDTKIINCLVGFFNLVNLDSNKITKKLQINFNDGTWTDCPLSLKIIFPDRTMSMSLSDEDNLKRLGSCIIHNQNIPLSLLILQHSKSIIDLRIRYVSLAMAAEIGVKEAFSSQSTELRLLIENLPSPSIVKLTSDKVFNPIFGWKIPKELRAALGKGMECRNKLIHTNGDSINLDLEKVIDYQEKVQLLIALLYKNALGHNETTRQFYENLMDFVRIDPGEATNQSKINLTEAQKEAISKSKKNAALKIIVSEL
ncbi:hypothetical protein [Lentilactobacillus buchneri]|uniref:hypothetical protein n=1 Tax=Lentilactobacillus buchneri TaxID=1581 RepID=UPI00177B18C7|nr:hypothetical protein [Lentilactobacillus buchneri]